MTPSPDAWFPSQAVGKVKNVAGWSSPVAREAHNLEVTGSNPVPATWPVLTTGSIPEEPAATRVVAAGSVVFCGSSPADAGACGVAFRVSMASHFALQLGTPPCPASPGIGSPPPPPTVNRRTGSGASISSTTTSIPGSPGPTTPSGPVPRSSRAVGWLRCSTCRWSRPRRTSCPWLSLRETRSRGYASGPQVGASRLIGRACIRGQWSAVVGSGRGRREVREPGVN